MCEKRESGKGGVFCRLLRAANSARPFKYAKSAHRHSARFLLLRKPPFPQETGFPRCAHVPHAGGDLCFPPRSRRGRKRFYLLCRLLRAANSVRPFKYAKSAHRHSARFSEEERKKKKMNGATLLPERLILRYPIIMKRIRLFFEQFVKIFSHRKFPRFSRPVSAFRSMLFSVAGGLRIDGTDSFVIK